MKRHNISTFSTSPKVEAVITRLHKETGKNRSQIIRDLITANPFISLKPSVANNYHDNYHSNTPEYIVPEFIKLLNSGLFLITCNLVITKGDKLLIIYPKKPGHLIKYSTWEFPTIIPEQLDFSPELIQKAKKYYGLSLKIDKLITGRLVPEHTKSNQKIISLFYHCRLLSGKIIPSSTSVSETKWIPAAQIGRYFSHSLGDHLITWLSQLK